MTQLYQVAGPRADEIGTLMAFISALTVVVMNLRTVITEHQDDVKATRAVENADKVAAMIAAEFERTA